MDDEKVPSKLGALTLLLVMLHVACPFTDKESELIISKAQMDSAVSILETLC